MVIHTIFYAYRNTAGIELMETSGSADNKWTAENLRQYACYRISATGRKPDAGNSFLQNNSQVSSVKNDQMISFQGTAS